MHRSGFVAILGRPNVGKSTLLNALVGQKIAIESPVAQTTRHRIKGVLSSAKGQVIFLDTPGFSKPLTQSDQLGNYLTNEGLAALSEADAFVMLVDGTVAPGKGDAWVAEQIRQTGKFVLLIINKIDRIKQNPALKLARKAAYADLLQGYPNLEVITVSAKTGKNLSTVADTLLRKLPEGPAYYPDDAVTDQRLREISAELIREKVLLNTREEIPHSVAIGIERFDESNPEQVRIAATLYVDQESQKGILIGQAGQMIKTIGMQARREIEQLLESHVHLELNVKLKKNWRRDPQFLQALGLALPATPS
ncbi:MAG: GTPase Era [Vampirovibrionales bacterium]|nr:GTPase Era [Vampirovibrionales bacterium]